MSPSPNNSGYQGAQDVGSGTSETNALAFFVSQMMAKTWVAMLVLVKGVTNEGGIEPVGFVDIQPMVAQIDGKGNATPHGIIYQAPYFRLQGGANAVILDPQIGDIGIALFAHSDISSVKVNKAPANPGSRRKFDPADAIYIGGVLNGVPSQYVQFSAAGIKMLSPFGITLEAPTVAVVGALTATLEITAKAGSGSSVTLTGHKHGTGSPAAGTSVPTGGT